MERFDRFLWNPAIYTEVKDIKVALKANDINSKTIREIHTIGYAEDGSAHDIFMAARRKLAAIGISYDDIDNGVYPYLDQTLLPCQLTVCEPTVFVFEDDSTMEMQPMIGGRLKLSFNQISPQTIDGTNHANVYSQKVFSALIGRTINDISCHRKTNRIDSGSSYCDKYTSEIWKWYSNESYGFFMDCGGMDGWYTCGVFCQNYFYSDGKYDAVTIPYSDMQQIVRQKKQIVIVEGHDSSSYFWINPIMLTDEENKRNDGAHSIYEGVEEYTTQEISIEEDDVFEFLYYFLLKYYDVNVSAPFRREYDPEDFEWNLTHNVYTYEAVKKMLADIREHVRLLQADFGDPQLDEWKERFRISSLVKDYYFLSQAQQNELTIRDHVNVIVDFYERFCLRMEAMMKYAPQYDLISFMGP